MTDKKSDHHATPDMSEMFVLPHQHIHLSKLDAKFNLILDVGGGGEGIIGNLMGAKVVAIDKNKRELMETNNEALKVVMDAKELKFVDDSFDAATVFFTLMYMPDKDLETVMSELWRVLKPGGELLIWDTIVKVPPEEKDKKYFLVTMNVHFPDDSEIEAGYGYFLKDQTTETFLVPAQKVGFKVLEKKENDYTFFLQLQKPEIT